MISIAPSRRRGRVTERPSFYWQGPSPNGRMSHIVAGTICPTAGHVAYCIKGEERGGLPAGPRDRAGTARSRDLRAGARRAALVAGTDAPCGRRVVLPGARGSADHPQRLPLLDEDLREPGLRRQHDRGPAGQALPVAPGQLLQGELLPPRTGLPLCDGSGRVAVPRCPAPGAHPVEWPAPGDLAAER